MNPYFYDSEEELQPFEPPTISLEDFQELNLPNVDYITGLDILHYPESFTPPDYYYFTAPTPPEYLDEFAEYE